MIGDAADGSLSPGEWHIHILDPDPPICEALSLLFRLEGFQTSFSLDAPNFYAAFERRRIDTVILNQRLGADDGIAVLRRIKLTRHGLPVFVLQDKPMVDLAVTAMKAGANDVLPKPVDADHLLDGVRAAIYYETQTAPNGLDRQIEVRGFEQLTPREREVLQLISNGQSNKEAGRQLGISPRTIEVHRARVMEKLGAKNTADLMRIVLMT